jgi:ankyrin repeat protein
MQPNQVAPRTWASRSKPARSRWLLRRSRGMLTKFERLINDGMDVNVLGSNGWTPLVSAAETGETNAVLFLHKHGANTNLADEIGSTPLMGVSSAGELAAVEAVVQHGAEVRAANRRKWTPLHVAARWGHYHVVKFLIKSRTDINAQTEMRNTPLRVAAIWGEVAVAGCLLRNGADVSISNSSGLTPLMEASRSGNIEIVEDLMRHGEEVHATPRRAAPHCRDTERVPAHSPRQCVPLEAPALGGDSRLRLDPLLRAAGAGQYNVGQFTSAPLSKSCRATKLCLQVAENISGAVPSCVETFMSAPCSIKH